MDEIQHLTQTIKSIKESMEYVYTNMRENFATVRTSRALPNMLDSIYVSCYNNMQPLNQVASVSAPDPRTLTIKPWDKKLIQEIENAIVNSKLELKPSNNGEVITIRIPAMTEERRLLLVKQVKTIAEQACVSIRNVRMKYKDSIKNKKGEFSEDYMKKLEAELQKVTDLYVGKINTLLEDKKSDIMKV
jgi:ribosome recycling factor